MGVVRRELWNAHPERGLRRGIRGDRDGRPIAGRGLVRDPHELPASVARLGDPDITARQYADEPRPMGVSRETIDTTVRHSGRLQTANKAAHRRGMDDDLCPLPPFVQQQLRALTTCGDLPIPRGAP